MIILPNTTLLQNRFCTYLLNIKHSTDSQSIPTTIQKSITHNPKCKKNLRLPNGSEYPNVDEL